MKSHFHRCRNKSMNERMFLTVYLTKSLINKNVTLINLTVNNQITIVKWYLLSYHSKPNCMQLSSSCKHNSAVNTLIKHTHRGAEVTVQSTTANQIEETIHSQGKPLRSNFSIHRLLDNVNRWTSNLYINNLGRFNTTFALL